MKTIPINTGYFNCKSINKQIFKSRISEFGYSDISVKSDVLQYENKTYVIGEGKINIKPDKTENNFLKLLTLNMLARFVDDEKEDFNLVLTAPPNVYASQKEHFPKYLVGKHEITHNGKKKKINILNVNVFPETITAYFSNTKTLNNPMSKVLIIDIGGVTTNGAMVQGGTFTKDGIFTIQNGMYHLDNSISKYLNGQHYLHTTYDDINNYRKNGLYILGGKQDLFAIEKKNINGFYKNHVEKIIEQAELNQWDVKTSEILVTGGGGKVLFDVIKEYLPQAKLSMDPIFDNLNGLDIIAKQVYKK